MGVVRSDVSPEFVVTTLGSANHSLGFDPLPLVFNSTRWGHCCFDMYYDNIMLFILTDGHVFTCEFAKRCV